MSVGYVEFDTSTSSRLGTPAKSQLEISGDFELILNYEPLNGWSHTGNRALVTNGQGAASTRGFRVASSAFSGSQRSFILVWWDEEEEQRTAQLFTYELDDIYTGDHGMLRIRFDIDNGSSQTEVHFAYSNDPVGTPHAEINWTNLGSHTQAIRTLNAATATLSLGGDATITGAQGNYRLYEMALYDGWLGQGGTLVANPDPRADAQGWDDPPANDGVGAGNVWSLFGSASWEPPDESGALLDTPVITVDDTSDTGPEITVSWDPVTGADHYEYEVEVDDNESWVPLTDGTVETSPAVIDDSDGLAFGMAGRVRVRAMPPDDD